MSNYYIAHDGELYHYGVKGMQWGVRRNLKRLHTANQTGDKKGHNRAVKSLYSHQNKINKKLGSLDKQSAKLEAKRYRQSTKSAPKIAKLESQAARYLDKSYRTRSEKRAAKYRRKTVSLRYQASKMKASVAKTQARIEQNKHMQEAFKKGLSEINNELITKGQGFLYDED